jgi:hypothetical protein
VAAWRLLTGGKPPLMGLFREKHESGCDVVKLGAVSSQSVARFVNTLDLLGKQVRHEGEVGVVVSHSEPTLSRKGADR